MSCGRSARPEPDLGRLLAEQAGPEAQLALALQRGRLGVEPADQDQVAVEAAVLLVGEVEVIVRVLHPLPLRGQQLHQLGAAAARVGLGGDSDVDRHAPLLARTPHGIAARGGPARPGCAVGGVDVEPACAGA